MTDPSKQKSTPFPEAADPVVAPKSAMATLSPIWFLPLVAVLIALGLVWRHYTNQGPLITIVFDSAEGIEAGRTPIKYLDVEMGRVKRIEIDKESHKRVVVTARMAKGARDYLNEGTKFWVTRPRIGFSGISGLQTLLSGGYIEMSSTVTGAEMETTFRGLEQPPLTPGGAPGLRVQLRADEAGYIEAGSPVFYRRFKVGAVESRRLSENGEYAEFRVFIDAPYHRLINTNTRFWNASGIDVMVDTAGFTVHSESLETLLSGGIAFSNPPRLQAGAPVKPGALFTLYDSRAEAEIRSTEGVMRRLGYVLHFDESLHGLETGAPVEHRGVQIGYVADIDIRYNKESGLFETPTLIFLEPQRIQWPDEAEIEAGLRMAVEKHGMRARLQTASMLTGALFVDLVLIPDGDPARIVPGKPYPEFPTVPSPFGQMTTKAVNLFDTLKALPLEELVSSASQFFRDIDALVRVPTAKEMGEGPEGAAALERLRSAPLARFLESMSSTLTGIRAILDARETRDLPSGIAGSLQQLDETLKAIRGLLQGSTTTSSLSYEFSTALQELTHAARAVRSLTETLENKPDALIFGK